MLVGQRNFAIRHSFAAAPFDVLGYGPALFLGDAGKYGQHQLTFAVEGVDVLFLEKDLHIGGLEFPNRGQCVDRVRAKRETDFVTMRSIEPVIASSISLLKPSRRLLEVPVTPSSVYSPANSQFGFDAIYWT